MFSANIRQDHQCQDRCDFVCEDKKSKLSHLIDDHPSYAIPPYTNSLTYNDKIEIINENDRNSVSEMQFYANACDLIISHQLLLYAHRHTH